MVNRNITLEHKYVGQQKGQTLHEIKVPLMSNYYSSLSNKNQVLFISDINPAGGGFLTYTHPTSR